MDPTTPNVVQRPGGFRSRRFVFAAPRASAEVRAVAAAAGWQPTVDRPASPDGGKPLLLGWEPLPGLAVTYTEKPAVETCFVMAASALGAAEVEGCVSVFAAHPFVRGRRELLGPCDSADTTAALGVALARAGLGAPVEADEGFVRRLESGAFHDDPAVREGALWGMAYAEWAVFRPTLATAAEEDGDEFLRRVAASALRAFDAVGVPGTP
ncbi:hypothetical protein AB0I28_34095 [Phytomonospora sp. NPDC050363]|uniref:hypothetical protein n=1 Tax=Phytomonospora sp. NPDC050363 TaxID=3155642 RepID=UPI0033DA363C